MATKQKSKNKSFLTAFWLATILGIVGADRFYLGYNFTGFLKLFTLGGFGVWVIFDIIYTLSGKRLASDGKPLSEYIENIHSIILGLPVSLIAMYPILHIQLPAITSNIKALGNNTTNYIALTITVGFVLGCLVFFGFNIVDPLRRKRWLWAAINLVSSALGAGIVSIIYYFFVRNSEKSTTLI